MAFAADHGGFGSEREQAESVVDRGMKGIELHVFASVWRTIAGSAESETPKKKSAQISVLLAEACCFVLFTPKAEEGFICLQLHRPECLMCCLSSGTPRDRAGSAPSFAHTPAELR